MTVSYQYEVASSTSGGFTRLLFMWRGSLYKLIYRELLLFLGIFGSISALYRHGLSPEQKRSFEHIVVYCDTFISLIPLSFVLGFYVAYVAGRWWQQYTAIPWPDKVMHSVALYVIGNDEYGRMVRRALMRYLNLSLILVLRSISSAVKRRFPTLDHVVDSGFMTSLELELFISVPSLEFNTYWIPCTWFINLLKEARTNHRLPDPQGLKIIMEEFNDFRSKCGMLWSYDWVSIPLVYTQVVTLATYSFFAVALVGRQYIEAAIKPFQMKIDIYFPMFTILQFFFFMGLLKVAEQLINPFGDDDEDFELNWLIDRHTKVSYLGVDTLMNRCPPLVKDIYYDSENIILPYTEAAAAYKRKTYRGSVANMTVPEEKQTMFLPDILEEEETTNESLTPKNSSANLAAHNESSSSKQRQGYLTPQTNHRSGRDSRETVVTLDIREELDQQQPQHQQKSQQQQKIQQQQQQQQQQPNSHPKHQLQQQHSSSSDQVKNGRSSSALAEAVKIFSGRNKPPDFQSRKPFFALAKSSKVNIQPWPSATNLKSEAVAGSNWSKNLSENALYRKKIHQSLSFNIPSIEIRRSSMDADIDDDDYVDEVEEETEASERKKRSQRLFEARSRLANRSFAMFRPVDIDDSRCNCDYTTSSNNGSCYNPSCFHNRMHHLRLIRSSTRSEKSGRKSSPRVNSFSKFLAKHPRSRVRSIGIPISPNRRPEPLEGRLPVSKSSPELTTDLDFGANERARRAVFFTGDDDEIEEDPELQDIVQKKF